MIHNRVQEIRFPHTAEDFFADLQKLPFRSTPRHLTQVNTEGPCWGRIDQWQPLYSIGNIRTFMLRHLGGGLVNYAPYPHHNSTIRFDEKDVLSPSLGILKDLNLHYMTFWARFDILEDNTMGWITAANIIIIPANRHDLITDTDDDSPMLCKLIRRRGQELLDEFKAKEEKAEPAETKS